MPSLRILPFDSVGRVLKQTASNHVSPFQPNSCVNLINIVPSGDSQGSCMSSRRLRLSQVADIERAPFDSIEKDVLKKMY